MFFFLCSSRIQFPCDPQFLVCFRVPPFGGTNTRSDVEPPCSVLRYSWTSVLFSSSLFLVPMFCSVLVIGLVPFRSVVFCFVWFLCSLLCPEFPRSVPFLGSTSLSSRSCILLASLPLVWSARSPSSSRFCLAPVFFWLLCFAPVPVFSFSRT